MPLPEKETIILKGVKLSDSGPVAVGLTLTQKQVEALFGRKDELKPLEIDFDNKKLIIGDMASSFTTAAEETNYREMCRRLPTGLDNLKPLTTWGSYIGRLHLQRNDQEIASNIKKKTLAENLKRDEHKTVFLDTPPPITAVSSGKRGKQSANLMKKALSKSQANARSVGKDSASSSARSLPTATSQSPTTSGPSNIPPKASNLLPSSYETPKELPKIDLGTFRSRAVHGLGAFKDQNDKDGMTLSEFKALMNRITGRAVSENACLTLLQSIGERVSKDSSRWQLKTNSWCEVRPDDAPHLTEEERQNLRRKGRIALNPPLGDPFWSLFQLKLEKPEGLKKDEEVFKMNKPPKSLAGTIPKGKVAARAKGTKPSTSTSDILKKPTPPTPVTKKGKTRGEPNKTTTQPSVPGSALSKREETKATSSSNKVRPLKMKEPSPLSRPSLSKEVNIRKRAATAMSEDGGSEMEEGELPASGTKKRKISDLTDAPRLDPPDKPASNSFLSVKNAKDRNNQLIEEGVQRSRKESAVPRTNISSSSRTSSGNQTVKREPRDSDVERLQEPVKRKHRDRRKTPEFSSSSDEGEEDEPPAKRRATSSRSTLAINRPSTLGTAGLSKSSSSKGSSTNKPPVALRSYPLPSDKEGVRREYKRRYPQYMSLKSELLAQYAKVEELFNNLKEADSVSDNDVLEQEELDRLVSEYKGLEQHLEQLTAMHTKLNTAY